MVVANLPAKRPESSVPDAYADQLGALIAQGNHPRDIARQLHPEDRTARLRAYKRLRNMALRDARVAHRVQEDAQLELMVALGPVTEALSRRGKRGRIDAIKLIYEASGYHNPRVKHEHSGDIKISIETVPRPSFDEANAVVDADVVED